MTDTPPLYYVYPNGDFYSTEDHTLDELITLGHSDDCVLIPLPHDTEGYPFVPPEVLACGA